jgi:hypothetical protein
MKQRASGMAEYEDTGNMGYRHASKEVLTKVQKGENVRVHPTLRCFGPIGIEVNRDAPA